MVQDYIVRHSDTLLTIFGILIATLVTSLVIDLVFRAAGSKAHSKRAKTLVAVGANTLKLVVFAIALFIISDVLQIDVTPLLASAGIIGLAVGFGAQLLIRDVLTGMFFIMENQFNAGDWVRIDTTEGVIEHVGLRTLAIRDSNTGALTIIPNGSIPKVANLSDSWSRVIVPIVVPAKNDVDKVKSILEKAAQAASEDGEIAKSLLAPISVYALDDLTDTTMTFKVAIKTSPGKQEHVGQYFRYLVKKEFEKAKINLA